MRYEFSLIYDLDTTVAVAVAAYLDAEHYCYLHSKYSPAYEVIEHEDCKMLVRQTWVLGPWRVGQTYTTVYEPPARFIAFDIKPSPRWLPSVHHLVRVRTDLRYYPDSSGDKTVSHLDVTIDMPFWLWPLRNLVRRRIEQLKIEKDAEDIEMIDRRAAIFGRGNIKAYLPKHQFLFHKDHFVKHFGGD